MSLDEIRRKADCLRTGLRRQNRVAYIFLAVLVGAFGWITVWFTPTNLIMRTGGCLVVLGCLYGVAVGDATAPLWRPQAAAAPGHHGKTAIGSSCMRATPGEWPSVYGDLTSAKSAIAWHA